MFSIGIYIFTFLYLNCFLHAVIYFVHCALSLIILFYICACCDTRYFKNVCLFLFVEVKALLGLCYMLYNIRRKIKFLCLCQCHRRRSGECRTTFLAEYAFRGDPFFSFRLIFLRAYMYLIFNLFMQLSITLVVRHQLTDLANV